MNFGKIFLVPGSVRQLCVICGKQFCVNLRDLRETILREILYFTLVANTIFTLCLAPICITSTRS